MYEFEWNPAKAENNLRKHNVSFEYAGEVFLDPISKSIPDEEHSEFEERWITVGCARDGRLLVVSHTEVETEGGNISIRLISARFATRKEQRQYASGE